MCLVMYYLALFGKVAKKSSFSLKNQEVQSISCILDSTLTTIFNTYLNDW